MAEFSPELRISREPIGKKGAQMIYDATTPRATVTPVVGVQAEGLKPGSELDVFLRGGSLPGQKAPSLDEIPGARTGFTDAK